MDLWIRLTLQALVIFIICTLMSCVLSAKYEEENSIKTKTKKKKIQELEQAIEVLKFQIDNPTGIEVITDIFHSPKNRLRYVKDNEIKEITLPTATSYAFYDGYIRDTSGNVYEFDAEIEMLIKIKEVYKQGPNNEDCDCWESSYK